MQIEEPEKKSIVDMDFFESEKTKQRMFIAHRGVHLKSSIAGENSLEAIRLARDAGFNLIETDVRWTYDSILVAMHDATINRTCLLESEEEIDTDIYVAKTTLRNLKDNYILKADDYLNRTKIPTLEEYLSTCGECGLIPFIEPKINDPDGYFYKEIIKTADRIMGKNNYVITSNNYANSIIRGMGIQDIILMGILYQTSFEEIVNLGNTIMAISATQIDYEEYTRYVKKCDQLNIPTESHANNYGTHSLVTDNKIDIISTDIIAPDLEGSTGLAVHIVSDSEFSEFEFNGSIINNTLELEENGTLLLKNKLPKVSFGGVFFEIKMQGSCELILGNQKFTISEHMMNSSKHQLMVYDCIPQFSLIGAHECVIEKIDLMLKDY